MTTLIPRMVRGNVELIKKDLETASQNDRGSLVEACYFLAELLQSYWHSFKGRISAGVETRLCIAEVKDVLVICDALLEVSDLVRHFEPATLNEAAARDLCAGRLNESIGRIMELRGKAAAFLQWLESPSPDIEPELIKAKSSVRNGASSKTTQQLLAEIRARKNG